MDFDNASSSPEQRARERLLEALGVAPGRGFLDGPVLRRIDRASDNLAERVADRILLRLMRGWEPRQSTVKERVASSIAAEYRYT